MCSVDSPAQGSKRAVVAPALMAFIYGASEALKVAEEVPQAIPAKAVHMEALPDRYIASLHELAQQ